MKMGKGNGRGKGKEISDSRMDLEEVTLQTLGINGGTQGPTRELLIWSYIMFWFLKLLNGLKYKHYCYSTPKLMLFFLGGGGVNLAIKFLNILNLVL